MRQRERSAQEDRAGHVSSLQDALAAFLRGSGLGERLRHAAVFEAWSGALGPALCARARPVRFDGGDLTVEVESAAHMHELKNFTGEPLRRAANERLHRAGSRENIQHVVFKLKR
jgi:hypothetical protein